MKHSWLEYTHSLVSERIIEECGKRLQQEIERMRSAIKQQYNSVYASLYVPYDHHTLHTINTLIEAKKKYNPSVMVVVGIGGSSLGSMAMQQALYGLLYNEQEHVPKVYYVETLDPHYIHDVRAQVEKHLGQQESMLLVIISKSGTTLETIANGAIFLDVLQEWYPDTYQHYVVVVTDQDSPLHQYAQQERFDLLLVPKHVGGRYSVFSAVGLFVLGMLGIDIAQILEGAQSALDNGLHVDIFKNQAALLASILYSHYQNRYTKVNFFTFCMELEMLGKWYRQLVGESLGKEFDVHGNKVHAGITPLVSVGTTDLHSVGQLYLAGPADMFTVFVISDQWSSEMHVAKESSIARTLPYIIDKPFSSILHGVLDGVQQVFAQQKKPFVTMYIERTDAFSMGQIMQFFMMHIMYMGFLMEVNPFDQPHVQLYKEEAQRILSNE